MALIQVNFLSKTLMRTVPINVILPVDKLLFPGMPERDDKPYKTLYLLHGIFGNYTDWVSGTNIQRWAQENDLAVVMPSGDNMFYVDNPKISSYYGEFIGKELVEITRKMFPLSKRREDTYIAGLSMGGYGAIRNGLKYHDTFGYIAGLSSALIIDDIEKRTDDVQFFFESRSFAEGCFGDLTKVKNSDMNPKWLIKKLVEEKVDIPKIYMACGKDDFLFKANQEFKDYLDELGVEVTFEVGPGGHEWDFWNRYIYKVLQWLPLEKNSVGIDSGNIGI
ncbi:acetylesterase [Caloramator sp. E03]|uniref:alpha/beta hydrolase n=1 Tax=Caloramator sp. E03 TaxID=2576307 RepID=UPI001110D8B3|nr:alpha/beta hydrolase family protein [Caloramator sp. E03]QCX34291.1 acetylesterase [Caloramator sp. E03]